MQKNISFYYSSNYVTSVLLKNGVSLQQSLTDKMLLVFIGIKSNIYVNNRELCLATLNEDSVLEMNQSFKKIDFPIVVHVQTALNYTLLIVKLNVIARFASVETK